VTSIRATTAARGAACRRCFHEVGRRSKRGNGLQVPLRLTQSLRRSLSLLRIFHFYSTQAQQAQLSVSEHGWHGLRILLYEVFLAAARTVASFRCHSGSPGVQSDFVPFRVIQKTFFFRRGIGRIELVHLGVMDKIGLVPSFECSFCLVCGPCP